MKASDKWSSGRYLPPDLSGRVGDPYVCRLAPFSDGFEFEILDPMKAERYRVDVTERGTGKTFSETVTGTAARVRGLPAGTDLSFRVTAPDDRSSSERMLRCGDYPGTVVNYIHPGDPEYSFSGRFPASPSLVKLPGGALLASMDIYAAKEPQNLTLIFRSDDGGRSWRHLTELFPCFWGKLFLCGGSLYMLACSTEYGDLLIGRSDDGGENWTAPVALFRGSSHFGRNGWHRAPVPVLIKDGRVMTDVQYGSWPGKRFLDAVLSADAGRDLTDPGNWVCSGFFDASGTVSPMPEKVYGGIEGNLVARPDGGISDLLRFDDGHMLVLGYDPRDPETPPRFERLADFPSTASKFDVLQDPVSKRYYSIVNYPIDDPKTKRNLLSLVCSDDLIRWRLCGHLIDCRWDDPSLTGFQYADLIIDGDDILYLSRTAVCGADSFHNANCITFHKIEQFREL